MSLKLKIATVFASAALGATGLSILEHDTKETNARYNIANCADTDKAWKQEAWAYDHYFSTGPDDNRIGPTLAEVQQRCAAVTRSSQDYLKNGSPLKEKKSAEFGAGIGALFGLGFIRIMSDGPEARRRKDRQPS